MATHIIPTGANKTLCGLPAKKTKGTSIGLGADCEDCLNKGIELINIKMKS